MKLWCDGLIDGDAMRKLIRRWFVLLHKHGLTYKIKWKHYKEMTWEPEENLKGCDRALLRFHEQNPEKPGPPAWVEKTPAPKRPRGPRKH